MPEEPAELEEPEGLEEPSACVSFFLPSASAASAVSAAESAERQSLGERLRRCLQFADGSVDPEAEKVNEDNARVRDLQ